MSSDLLLNRIRKIQEEYKALLIKLLPKLTCSYAYAALDEIHIFWRKLYSIIRLYLKQRFANSGGYIFTATSCLHCFSAESASFILMGNNLIFDDPLGEYAVTCNELESGKDAEHLYMQIGKTAQETVSIIENIGNLMLVLPIRLISQIEHKDIIYQIASATFLALFRNIDSIEDYSTCAN